MSMRKVLIAIAIGWLVAITLVHAWLNLHLFAPARAEIAIIKNSGSVFAGDLSPDLSGHRFH